MYIYKFWPSSTDHVPLGCSMPIQANYSYDTNAALISKNECDVCRYSILTVNCHMGKGLHVKFVPSAAMQIGSHVVCVPAWFDQSVLLWSTKAPKPKWHTVCSLEVSARLLLNGTSCIQVRRRSSLYSPADGRKMIHFDTFWDIREHIIYVNWNKGYQMFLSCTWKERGKEVDMQKIV